MCEQFGIKSHLSQKLGGEVYLFVLETHRAKKSDSIIIFIVCGIRIDARCVCLSTFYRLNEKCNEFCVLSIQIKTLLN